MQPARPGRREADAESPGELGVAARHEGGGLLVADLDEANRLAAFAQRLHDAVDAVARQAEDRIDAPVLQHLNQNVSSRLSHGAPHEAAVSGASVAPGLSPVELGDRLLMSSAHA